ncbi:MAGE family-domain-containing protein [Mycena vitilis]|nr:MAGE family-domain-containing protein [Mycena vitilis]
MARATTRSQKPAAGRASGASQAQPSQTQRSQKRRGQVEEDDEEEEEDDDDDGEGRDMDVDEDGGESGLKRAATALVRLAMFTEHKRLPLRRDEISKKVLGSSTRAFPRVLEMAQERLRNVFGMELVELRSRAELDKDKDTGAAGDDLEEARKATGVKKKSAAAGSKTYILRSTLDARIIAEAARTHEEILEDEAADAPSDDDDDDPLASGGTAYGSIISWSSADHVGALGVLYVILALILVSGRVMGDQDLRATLARLRLPSSSSIPFSATATHRTLSLDLYLTLLLRQGFLDRAAVGGDAANKAAKGAGRGKRTRVAAADEDQAGGQTYEWRWGARAQSEVGEQAVAAFVTEFMVSAEGGGEDAEDGAEDNAAGRARANKKRADAANRLEKMAKGIERAAGGQLAAIM